MSDGSLARVDIWLVSASRESCFRFGRYGFAVREIVDRGESGYAVCPNVWEFSVII